MSASDPCSIDDNDNDAILANSGEPILMSICGDPPPEDSDTHRLLLLGVGT